jgi:hypothetical protein
VTRQQPLNYLAKAREQIVADFTNGRRSRDDARAALVDNGSTLEAAEWLLDQAERTLNRARAQ